jgi:Zn-dependent protease/CBS domain-containing protein
MGIVWKRIAETVRKSGSPAPVPQVQGGTCLKETWFLAKERKWTVGKGFGIGKVFGISVRLDWSWLLIFVLTTWNLGNSFGELHPDWGSVMRWGVAVAAALLFFASVLVHELAHSLVARARGIPVRSITLFMFGGVSNIQREPHSPGTEFWMSIVGPLTSLILGGALTVIASASAGLLRAVVSDPRQALAALGPLATLLGWLGSINFSLGLFNLIPGFPLDGGRMLRSLIWSASDDLRRATRWASWAGQGIAWLMIMTGIGMTFGLRIPFFGTGVSNGLWLAFIGWFLNSASAQSYQRVVVRDILEGVAVKRMMRSCPPTVRPGISISDLVHEHVMKTDDHAFPVMEDGRLVGLVTLEDVRSLSRGQWDGTPVRKIMTPAEELVTVKPEVDAAEALDKLMARDVRQLPVIENGSLAGCLRRRDIVKWLQLHGEMLEA